MNSSLRVMAHTWGGEVGKGDWAYLKILHIRIFFYTIEVESGMCSE